MSTVEEKKPLTMKEAADYLRMDRTTLWRRTKAGLITYRREGKRCLFRREDLDAYLDRQLVNGEAAAVPA